MSMRDEIQNAVKKMLTPLRNRVYTMITRAIVETVKDSDGMQLVKLNLFAGEARTDVERFQNFGFTSVPPSGAECIAIAVGGNRDHLIVIVADDRLTRVKGLAKGESVQYNSRGDKWHLKKDGTLEGELLKFKVSNGTNELIDLLVQLADECGTKGKTNTIFGPLPKNNAVAIDAIKTKLESFKV